MNRIVPAICLAVLCLCVSAQAQAIDYIYAIEKGGTTAGSGWWLDEIRINPSTSNYTFSRLLDLSSAAITPLFGSTGHYNDCINALALDPVTHTIFYTYSYNTTTSATGGTFYAKSYALQSTGYTTYSSTNIYSISKAGNVTTDGTNPGGVLVNGTNGIAPATINVGSGWLPKGTFHNGSYYVGVQDEDSMVKIVMGNGDTNQATAAYLYSGINHGAQSSGAGGDFVFSGTGDQMYITGDVYPAYSPHTFATETLGNAISTTGSAYNYASVSTYYQLGGLDQISNLYASGTNSSGATTLYLVSNLSNLQSGSAPTLTALTSLSGTLAIINDLSDGSLSSIVLPEPATWGGGRFRSRAGGGRDAAATGQEAANSVRAHLLK